MNGGRAEWVGAEQSVVRARRPLDREDWVELHLGDYIKLVIEGTPEQLQQFAARIQLALDAVAVVSPGVSIDAPIQPPGAVT